jgi:hypothetical protein
LYDFNGAQAYDALRSKIDQKLGLNADDRIEFPLVEDVHEFFERLVNFYSHLITAPELPSYRLDILDLNDIFKDYRVAMEGNLLYEYALLVLAYVMQKRYKLADTDFNLNIEVLGSDEFTHSIDYTPFRKFNFVRTYGEF